MSKQEAISRYNLIIRKLRRKPASFKEIGEYLALESELQEYNFNVSRRTFQRDLDDIRAIYNIDIQYDFTRKVYYLDLDQQPDINERIVEAFEIFNALNINDRLSNYIHFEKRRPQGTDNLLGILQAIKNKLQIEFTYHKYWEVNTTHRMAEPYAIKEFKQRWYVLANDTTNNQIKSFAFDRLTELVVTKRHFQFPKEFDVKKIFQYSFGIISPNGKSPEKVVLSFKPSQNMYIKSLPLHDTQKIIIDSDKELRIQLTLFITYDFIMEILSHGDNVRVIEPQNLIDQIKATLKNTLKQY